MGAQYIGVGGVEDRLLDGLVEQRLGVCDEIGVERVVAGDQHGQRVAGAAARPPDLLPPGGSGAGEAGDDDRVESRHVDAELDVFGVGTEVGLETGPAWDTEVTLCAGAVVDAASAPPLVPNATPPARSSPAPMVPMERFVVLPVMRISFCYLISSRGRVWSIHTR